jgi:hypothetical protein
MNARPRPNSEATCSWTCGGVQAREAPAGFGWDHKAAAHAEFFITLADAVGDLCAAPVLSHGVRLAYDLMIGVGSAADSIVINSRKRMLAHIRAGEPGKAALGMENHLTLLRFMNRLATPAASPGQRAMDSIPEECGA